jgi:hypothetical protein
MPAGRGNGRSMELSAAPGRNASRLRTARGLARDELPAWRPAGHGRAQSQTHAGARRLAARTPRARPCERRLRVGGDARSRTEAEARRVSGVRSQRTDSGFLDNVTLFGVGGVVVGFPEQTRGVCATASVLSGSLRSAPIETLGIPPSVAGKRLGRRLSRGNGWHGQRPKRRKEGYGRTHLADFHSPSRRTGLVAQLRAGSYVVFDEYRTERERVCKR